MDIELYKIRSVGGCIKDGFMLFKTNFKLILRHTWLPAVAFTVFAALFDVVFTSWQHAMVTHYISPALAIEMILTSLLCYAATAWFTCNTLSIINGKGIRTNLPCVAKLFSSLLVIGILIILIDMLVSAIPYFYNGNKLLDEGVINSSLALTFGIYLFFALVLIPLAYSSMKYFIEPGMKLSRVFTRSCLTGWKHWGYLFLLFFLCGIIVSIIYIIADMPVLVAYSALQSDMESVALGDPSGLPSYLWALIFVGGAIASFIMIYVWAWLFMTTQFAYGHIETKEKTKNKNK